PFFTQCYFSVMFTCFIVRETAPIDIFPLSLHDALPICNFYSKAGVFAAVHRSLCAECSQYFHKNRICHSTERRYFYGSIGCIQRSEEHTSELQSRENLVCRLLLEKKK